MTLPLSDHFNGKTFFNPGAPRVTGLGDVLRWKLTSRPARWPSQVAVGTHPLAPAPSGPGMVVTWIGHSTFLVQTGQGNFLTDPVFSPRIGPVPWAGPRRAVAPGLALAALPKIHAILLSHDHYDHCDLPSLRALARDHAPLVVAPLNFAGLLRSARAAATVAELDWWQTTRLATGAQVRCVPARHWGRRSLAGTNVRLWGGFVLEAGGRRLYFAGDSAYAPALFEEIGQRAGTPDLALIPIGAYEPRWFMAASHMNPAEAVRVHQEVGARRSLGMHWGTFQLTDEAREDPPAGLGQARTAAGLPEGSFNVLEPGASVEI